MKAIKMLILFLLCVFVISITCLCLILSGTVSPFCIGFAMDSSDHLYIGRLHKIEIYSDGEKTGSMSPYTSRGYAFTIQEDDTILLSNASTVFLLDLSGNVLDEWEDADTSTFNRLQRAETSFVTRDGREYVMKWNFGRTKICSEQDVLYRMPLFDYIVKLALILEFLSFFVFIPRIILQWRKAPPV